MSSTKTHLDTLTKGVPRRPLHHRLLSSLAGFGLLLAGALMLILPGPGIVVMLAGLAVLSKEYPWAARILFKLKALWRKALEHLRVKVAKSPDFKTADKDVS